MPNPKDMTFDIQKYCAERFTDTVLSAAIEKGFPVRVYGGSAQAALIDLANDGYTLAAPFPARRVDFTRLLVTKSDQDPPLVVFIALNGDSMVTKISNALRLYRNEGGRHSETTRFRSVGKFRIFTDTFVVSYEGCLSSRWG